MSDYLEAENLRTNTIIMFMTAEILRLNAQKVEDDRHIKALLTQILEEIKNGKS